MGLVVSSSNVFSQLGQESAIGGGGAAGTKLRSLKIEPGDEIATREIMAQGHRFDTGTVTDRKWTSFNATEPIMTYTEHLYCLENIFGAGALSTVGTNTKKRIYDVPLTGGITPKTWTQQWGDPADNVNQYGYGLLADYSEKWDRDSGVSCSGAGIAQLVTTGGTFTSTPKQLAEVPIGAADFNIYLDTTGAGLGATQITDEIATLDWSVKGMKSERWAANSAQASFAGHVDLKPKWELKFTVYEGTVARPLLVNLKNGMTYFLRLDSQPGVYIDNYFTVGVGAATAGTFTLTYKGQTTTGIAFNATNTVVQNALTALTTIGAGNVVVTGTAPTWTVTMSGTLANDATVMTGSGTGLTGGAFAITATQNAYQARREFAIQLAKIAALRDTKGIYGREVTFNIVESPDSGWVHAALLTSQTAEATL
ncbi:MAG: hypothetical protein ACXWQR_20480 [Ktedonobacterales bacterium]